ncbi:MAG: hypothetical protein JO345_11615 [Streptosporangiaceae bacterium]|nr:hypothetical protein [Streptosporangiaceae bacterium]
MRRGTLLVLLWLAIGAAAAGQRGYFSSSANLGCSQGATIGVTLAAGPLNYLGVDAKIACKLPSPSP